MLRAHSKPGFRHYLKEELARRSTKNARYSLRSFARDLEVSPSTLSDVINARYGFSSATAKRISLKLNLSNHERELFCDLVDAEHGSRASIRKSAKARIQSQDLVANQLQMDTFETISDWHHYAILESLALEDAEHTVSWISKRLNLSPQATEVALDRLQRVGLIERTKKKIIVKDGFTATPSGVPSEAIRKFHRQILEKAIEALDTQTVEERSVSNMVLAVDPADLKEAEELIKKFRREFEAKFCRAQNAKEVYTLNVQFFRLTENRKPENS